MKKLFSLLLVLCCLQSIAQISEDFSDGDFTTAPLWGGDAAKFQVNTSGQLQLNDTQADTTYLSTSNSLIDNTEWNLYNKQSFASSANNYGRIYLVSDQSNLRGSLNGYFVQVGEPLDQVGLYKQSGTTTTSIISGTIANTNHSTNPLRIKVTRDAAGLWKLYTDTLGGVNFLLEGTATDITYTSTTYFGVWCKFTSSNATKFYYDDIYVGPIIVDVLPATILSIKVLSQTSLDVYFSEGLELNSSQSLANYLVNNSIGAPSTATRDAVDFSLVHLTFATPFTDGLLNTLTVNGVKDFNNNITSGAQKDFAYYIPQIYDVVINEIMADPDPPLGLPSKEFIELFNRKHFPLNLSGWTIAVGTSIKTIPDMVIPADSFAILSSSPTDTLLAHFGISVGVTSFPALTNTGATIILRDNTGKLISTVSYRDTWYQDAVKLNGGWTLEQIDPANPCGGSANWIASTDVSGGTPGRRNSVSASNPDNIAPRILNVKVINPYHLILTFSEPEDSLAMSSASSYFVDKSIGTPDSVKAISPDFASMDVYLHAPVMAEIVYTFTITGSVKDCAGNLVGTNNTFEFAIHEAKQFEIVFNEIMADPDPPVGLPNYEYVELYNRTDFPISLSGWTLTAGSSVVTLSDITIAPKKQLALTSVSGAVNWSTYSNIATMSSFPSISNDGAMLILSDTLGRMISNVNYTLDWYKNSSKSNGGWSIEKIDPENKCAGIENWTSSINQKGGTPGEVNSVLASNPDANRPSLLRATYINPITIRLHFTEQMDSTTLTNPTTYTIDNGIGTPSHASLEFPDYSKVILGLHNPLVKGTIYTIQVTSLVADCDGNLVSSLSSVKVAIPDTAASTELILNEVLYNPNTGGSDFVELYNNSQKVFDMKDIRITSADLTTDSIADVKEISSEGYLVFPNDYLVLSTDPSTLCASYICKGKNFFTMTSMPSFNIDFDVVAITDSRLNVIDKLHYSDKWQYPLLNVTKGVSLERINFSRSTQDSTNWHSAAESAGFATPGYLNSEFSDGVGDGSEVSVEPEIFSPDNDGYNDNVNIHFHFDSPGYSASVSIFDAKGRPIRALTKNELLGNDAVVSWDGINDNHEKGRIGIYIIYVEAFNLKGDVRHFKKTCVLGGKL